MKFKGLKEVITGTQEVDDDENERAFAELIQYLDKSSLSLVMKDARDKGREAFSILKEHYAGFSKPRIITSYNELKILQKLSSKLITGYII